MERKFSARAIDRPTALVLSRVIMECYRRGINDAFENIDDEGLILGHIEETKGCKRFGFIGETASSYLWWRNRLLDIGEKMGRYKTVDEYLSKRVGGKLGTNFFSVFIVLTVEFYNRGLLDYLNNPNGSLAKFNESSWWQWWGERSSKKFDIRRFRSRVQDICIRRSEKILQGGEDPISPNQYELFMTAFSLSLLSGVV